MEHLETTEIATSGAAPSWDPRLVLEAEERQETDGALTSTAQTSPMIRQGATVTLVPTGALESRAPWRGVVVAAPKEGLVLKNAPDQWSPRPGVGETVRIIMTSELFPVEADAVIVGSAAEGIALELSSSYKSAARGPAQVCLDVCIPLRFRRLNRDEIPRVRQAIRGWMREPERPSWSRGPSSSRTGEEEDLELLQRRIDRLEASLRQLRDFVVWPGIRGKTLAEEMILLSNEGICLEARDSRVAAGEVLELELLLPFEPQHYRVRATAIVERRAKERGRDEVAARFDVVDVAGREMIERYLFQVQRAHRRAAAARARDGLEARTKPRTSPATKVQGSERVPPHSTNTLKAAAPRDHLTEVAPESETQWQPRSAYCATSADADDALAEVFESMQELYRLRSVERCITFAVDLALRAISCAGAVGFESPDNETPRGALAVVTRGPGLSRVQGRRFALKGSLLEVALREGTPVTSSQTDAERQLFSDVDCLLGADTRSSLYAPFNYEGRTFGALVLINRSQDDSWTQGEISIVSYIAGCLGEHFAESLSGPTSFDDLDNPQVDSTVPLDDISPQRDEHQHCGC
jgi:hypothetical protein